MPIVTAIRRQARAGSTRYNVSLDGIYSFTVSDLVLSDRGLKVGQELSIEEAEGLRGDARKAKAYALALRYLGVRPRSRRELTDILQRKECNQEEIGLALERLVELGLVDDLKFCQAWMADRAANRPRSRLRLVQELAAKGVAREVIDEALGDVDPVQEMNALKALIARKRRSTGYGDDMKISAYLQRQGYSWTLIREALDELRADD